MPFFRAILALSLLSSVSASAAPRDYQLDPVHSRILFAVEHLGLSRAIGTFSAPRGWLRFDADDWSTASGEIELDLRTLDLGDDEWNRRMARRDSLDSKDNPIARWAIQRVEASGAHTFNAHGRLRFRGAEFPLSLAVTFNGIKRHPMTLRRTAGFSARASLSRAALGIDKWEAMVGDVVELQVEVEARRGTRRTGSGDSAEPGPETNPESMPTPEQEHADAATQSH
jgi:polyisoprenoid-binding protein YceI